MVRRKSGFQYVQRSKESLKRRETQSGSQREGYIKQDVKIWTPPAGLNRVRFLPPTWEDAGHFGLDVWVHYSVGPDQNTYLCLKRNPDLHDPEECPVCELRIKFQHENQQEAAEALNARKRVLAYIIDRNNEDDGPVLFPMAYTLDRDLAAACQDEDTGEVYFIDHPETGYDVYFRRDGQGQTTKYMVRKLSQKPSPITKDDDQQEEWLTFITENPIPDLLIWADPEAIAEAVSHEADRPMRKPDRLKSRGRRGASDEEDDEEEALPARGMRRRARVIDDEDEEDEEVRPPRRRRLIDDEEDEEAALRGKSGHKRRVMDEDDEDDDEEEDETPRRHRALKSGSRAATTTRKVAADDDDDEDEEPTRLRAPGAKRKSSDDDPDDDDDEPPTPPRRKVGAAVVKNKLGALRGKR